MSGHFFAESDSYHSTHQPEPNPPSQLPIPAVASAGRQYRVDGDGDLVASRFGRYLRAMETRHSNSRPFADEPWCGSPWGSTQQHRYVLAPHKDPISPDATPPYEIFDMDRLLWLRRRHPFPPLSVTLCRHYSGSAKRRSTRRWGWSSAVSDVIDTRHSLCNPLAGTPSGRKTNRRRENGPDG